MRRVMLTMGLVLAGWISCPAVRADQLSFSVVDCNSHGHMGQYYNPYCDGVMTFTNTDHELDKIEAYVADVWVDRQTAGFGHNPGSANWYYARCMIGNDTDSHRQSVSGGHTVVNDAYRVGSSTRVATSSYTWYP